MERIKVHTAVIPIMIGLLMTAGCSALGDSVSRPDIEAVDTFETGFGGAVGVEDVLWLSANRFDSAGNARMEIVKVDAISGEIESTFDLGPGRFYGGLAHHDGHLIVRREGLSPGVPTVPVSRGFKIHNEPDGLLRIDVSTGEIVQQFELPAYLFFDQLTVIEGKFWMHATSGLGTIDLDSGVSDLGLIYGYGPGTAVQVHSEGRVLWIVNPQDVKGFDLDTGQEVAHYWDESLQFGFKYHDGAYWVIGEAVDQFDTAYEYDLETGALSNPTPLDDLPVRTMDAGPYRWDLYRDDSAWRLKGTADPEPGDVWRQIDSETGVEVARYDFGDYKPRAATPGHLWLSRPVEDGSALELARLAIPDGG